MKLVHAQIAKSGFGQYPVVQTALVDSYSRSSSDIGFARQLFDEMSEKNVVSWTAMISGYTRVGQIGNAISLFDQMPERDVPSWNAVIAGCTQNGSAICIFEEMMQHGEDVRPDEIEHYGCLIDILGRAGKFEEALEVVRGMKIEPDEVVWGSLLNGCKVHGHTDLAEFAVKKLIEIDPKNGGYGIMLANLYGELGKWDESRKVRKMLKEHDAYKTPGCSWIEVDNKVNQFYSADKTHPRSEEIYKLLELCRA
ncbi:hypothetical protein GH714_019526 [Hevea brasiliensis]|uniref:Pentatricopeptide repeat-containing protein n=1 Tax=Hevea brasiliensis TaxID=3981 RepID=A0A6A6N4P4_HEVBR|nr:hypothetical protein GH714_019526 [Hevea brasiliensis]